MGSITGIVVITIGILVSVALHEVGHMLPAKKFGVLVPDYAVGFGLPCGRRRSGDYHVRFARDPAWRLRQDRRNVCPGSPGYTPRGAARKVTLAQEAREASAEEIPQGQEHRAFYLLSAPKKITVMLCGPLMNLLICFVLSAVTMVGIGAPACVSHDCFGVRNDPDLCGGDRLSGLRGRGSSRGHGPRVERNADRDLRTVPAGGGRYPGG